MMAAAVTIFVLLCVVGFASAFRAMPSFSLRPAVLRMSTSDEYPTTFSANWRATIRNVLNSGLTASAVVGLAGAKVVAEAGSDGFVTTESGLKYKDTVVGDGAVPQPGDTVRVHYTGWLDGFEEQGEKFDSSYDRRSPLVFKVCVPVCIFSHTHAFSLLPRC